MRSVVEWLCHMEGLMKVHDHDNGIRGIRDIQDIQDIRIILFILFILISRDMDIRGMVIHTKST